MKVMVTGKFNPLHPGHIFLFKKAKQLGDYLVVVVAHDQTILDQGMPLMFDAEVRKTIIENLKPVDKAVIGNTDDRFKVVEQEKPDILVLGYDQQVDENWIKQKAEQSGMKLKVIRIIEKLDGHKSTTIRENVFSKK